MPIPPREEEAGAIHHVYARGNNRAAVFHGDADRRLYLALLAYVARERKWHVLRYCLMTNHIHVLIETPSPNLGLGMRDLQRDYTVAFNARHGREGHVFHNPYRNRRVKDETALRQVADYIDANPATAGMVRTPEEWPWSSAGSLAAGVPAPCLDAWRLDELLNPQVEDVLT